MSDLISREEALKALKETYPTVWTESDYELGQKNQWSSDEIAILTVPSAEPEIIRCKDCKWCVEHYDTYGNAPYWICKNWDGGTDADGFCYEAERR